MGAFFKNYKSSNACKKLNNFPMIKFAVVLKIEIFSLQRAFVIQFFFFTLLNLKH